MRNGLTGKRTKTKRRATASRVTSPNNNGTMKLPAKSSGLDQKNEKTSAPQSMKVAITAKKNESRDQKKIEETSAQQSTKAATTTNKNDSRDQKKIEKTSAQQSTKAATPANKKQVNMKNSNVCAISEHFMSKFDVDSLVNFLVLTNHDL